MSPAPAQPSRPGPPLEYAPPLPWRRRRGARRVLWLLTGALVVAVGWHWRRPVVLRLEALYWQRQALRYVAGGDQVVYEGDPKAAAPAPADPQYVRMPLPSWPSVAARARFARPWEKFYATLEPTGRQPGPTLFLHERRRPGGAPRLVVVEGFFTPAGIDFDVLAVEATVYAPGSVARAPKAVGGATWVPHGPADMTASRLYAGQPDPQDPSHFTIDYDANGRRGVIEGWLNGDDSVTLEFRKEGKIEIRNPKPESPNQ